MLKRYENFLKEFDGALSKYFELHKKYIKCKKGCTDCCTKGEFPFSRLEAEYLMQAFVNLPKDVKDDIRRNIIILKEDKLKSKEKRFTYTCPFLVNSECALYPQRGIICRTYGLACLQKDGKVKLPNCAETGLNYREIYNSKTKELNLSDPVMQDLKIDNCLRSSLAEKYELECGEIRPLIDWF